MTPTPSLHRYYFLIYPPCTELACINPTNTTSPLPTPPAVSMTTQTSTTTLTISTLMLIFLSILFSAQRWHFWRITPLTLGHHISTNTIDYSFPTLPFTTNEGGMSERMTESINKVFVVVFADSSWWGGVLPLSSLPALPSFPYLLHFKARWGDNNNNNDK